MNIRTLGLGLGAFAAGAAAWIWGANRYGDALAKMLDAGAGAGAVASPPAKPDLTAEHVPTDLIGDAGVTSGTRAPDAFRPDPTAVPTAAEREALRPATGPAPTLVADRGSGFADAAGVA